MRTLDVAGLGEDKARIVEMLWAAFRISYPRKAKGYEQVKLCNRIGEKLESITTEAPVEGDEFRRVLRDGVERLSLEDAEHAKLLAMAKDEEIPWTFKSGPIVERMVQALDACTNGASHA